MSFDVEKFSRDADAAIEGQLAELRALFESLIPEDLPKRKRAVAIVLCAERALSRRALFYGPETNMRAEIYRVLKRHNDEIAGIRDCTQELLQRIQGSIGVTNATLINGLELVGVDPSEVLLILMRLHDVAEANTNIPNPAPPTGRPTSAQAEYALAQWDVLQAAGLGMRAAARIISRAMMETLPSYTEKDNGKLSDTIYQTIRNTGK